MTQQLVEGALNDLPRSEETRELVSAWLHSLESSLDRDERLGSNTEPDLPDDRQEVDDAGYEGDSSDESGNRAPVSIIKTKRLGPTVSQDGPRNSRKGSTASSGGPVSNRKGSTASLGGPVSNRKGSTASQGGPRPSRKRKRSPASQSGPSSSRSDDVEHHPKRRKRDSVTDSDQDDQLGFNPASLVKSKEGTFPAPPMMKKYLDKHMKRCLSKEERDAMFKEHPKPDLQSCNPPKVDKYISEFLGKRLSKEHDSELAKIQSAILAGIRPLTSAWQLLLDSGLENDPAMVVPASEVLTLIQCSLCMIGNASELVSQTRRSKILETIDHSWSKFGEGDFPSAKDTLFGEEFQASLTTKVEKDNALSKAVSITKRNKKQHDAPSSSRKEGHRNDRFFRGGPPAKYGGRQGKSFFPYNPHFPQKKEGGSSRGTSFPNYQRPGYRPLYHEPRLPQDQFKKTQQRKQ